MAKHLLVLLHGLLGSHNDFKNFINLFKSHEDSNEFIICSVSKNSGWFQTFDGIRNGALRAFTEVIDVIKLHRKTLKYISICGHSLGGLYARYLVFLLNKEKYFEKLKPCIFTTMATPHLGVRQKQTNPISICFQRICLPFFQTTRELALLDKEELLYKMSTSQEFIEPLKLFQRRALYSNVSNDPQVPYSTSSLRFCNPYRTSRIEFEIEQEQAKNRPNDFNDYNNNYKKKKTLY